MPCPPSIHSNSISLFCLSFSTEELRKKKEQIPNAKRYPRAGLPTLSAHPFARWRKCLNDAVAASFAIQVRAEFLPMAGHRHDNSGANDPGNPVVSFN